MTQEERAQIIRGRVRHQAHWVTIEKKIDLVNERQKKIAEGWVEFQGGWMTIAQKLALTGKAGPAPAAAPAQIFIQQNFNIREEHRHLHVSGEKQVPAGPSRILPHAPNALPEGERLRVLPPPES